MDFIDRQAAIDALRDAENHAFNSYYQGLVKAHKIIADLPSAQPEKKVFGNMSDEEFEKWLYEHGICHPDIHESISCSVVPLLIDDAISELPSTQRKGKWIWKDREVNRYRKETGTTEYGEVITIMVHDNYLQKINYCPVCGKRGDDTFMNYCPNCGAEMVKGEEDEPVN